MTMLERCGRDVGIGILILSVSGCVVIPVPRPIDDATEVRRDAVGRMMPRFQPGVTTRRDLVLALGEPDAVSADERKLIYFAPKWRIWWLVLGYYICDWGMQGDIDYLVADFDAAGLLIKFEEEENGPPLVPALSRFGGQRILLQDKATLITVRKWALDKFQPGTILLTETELIFLSHKPIANVPDLRMAYSDISDVQLKGWVVDALWLRCRSGAAYKFWIDHLNQDEQQKGKAFQESRKIIQSKRAL